MFRKKYNYLKIVFKRYFLHKTLVNALQLMN